MTLQIHTCARKQVHTKIVILSFVMFAGQRWSSWCGRGRWTTG